VEKPKDDSWKGVQVRHLFSGVTHSFFCFKDMVDEDDSPAAAKTEVAKASKVQSPFFYKPCFAWHRSGRERRPMVHLRPLPLPLLLRPPLLPLLQCRLPRSRAKHHQHRQSPCHTARVFAFLAWCSASTPVASKCPCQPPNWANECVVVCLRGCVCLCLDRVREQEKIKFDCTRDGGDGGRHNTKPAAPVPPTHHKRKSARSTQVTMTARLECARGTERNIR
jgi:hypothetical protein